MRPDRWLGVLAIMGCGADDSPVDLGDATTDVGSSDGYAHPDVSYPDVVIPKPASYATQVALAYCTRMKNCCASFDGGSFDHTACLATLASTGWANTNAGLGIPGILARGHLAMDNQAGQ